LPRKYISFDHRKPHGSTHFRGKPTILWLSLKFHGPHKTVVPKDYHVAITSPECTV